MSRRNTGLAAILATLTWSAAGCTTSTVEGPRVTDLPPGYGFSSQLSGARNVFLDERPIDEFGWTKSRGETHGSIELDRWGRSMSEAEIRAAREQHVERYEHLSYSPVVETSIDGRRAWTWFARGPSSREAIAVVPYDDETWVVEYHTRFRDELDEERMREVVRSFRRNPGRLGRVLVPVGFAAFLAWVIAAVRRFRG